MTISSSNPKLHIHFKSFFSPFLLFSAGLAAGFTLTLFIFPFPFFQFSSSLSLPFTFNQLQLSPSPLPSSPPPPPPPPSRVGLKEFLNPPPVLHDMTEEELLWRASLVPRRIPKLPSTETTTSTRKIAFLFLTKDGVSLAPLWELFFKGYAGLYSIYVHRTPSSSSTSTVDSSSVFYGRSIPSKGVKWGEPSMMEAERRLLANALLDFSNERFILLSESCIPLFNFSTVYNYLMGSKSTFIEAYDLPGPVGRGRYNPKMRPIIKLHQWRKGSQWFEMDRTIASQVISDQKYFSVFQKFCKPSCYMDEHYLPTFVGIRFPKTNSNRTLTWVDWSRGGAHPTRFVRTDVTLELLKRLRNGGHCEYNGVKTNLCHLFARKFMANSLNRLLMFAPKLMHFNR
uniref:Glycosyl transferase n=2 Tax=Cucumis sativus TaxID=3659 RepID=A0A0A0LUY5_CUCSA